MTQPLCECKERYAAMKGGEFLYSPTFEGWIFNTGPLRWMDSRTLYYAAERGVENHSGEPFVWTTCFACGLDLPSPTFDIVWRPDESDDGA